MDKKLEETIRQHYWSEYAEKATARLGGPLGAFLRWGDRMQKKYADKANVNFHSLAALGLAVVAGVTGAVVSGGAVPLIAGAGAFIAYFGVTIAAVAKVSSAAHKDFNADVADGSVLSRYKSVIGQKMSRLQSQEIALSTELDNIAKAGPRFNAAAAKPVKNPLAQRLGLRRGNTPKP